jgi:serine/threonine protein kinase
MTNPPENRTWLAPLIVAVLVAAFGFWCNTRVRQTIESQLKADLTTIIDANVTALEIWTSNQFNLATALAGDPSIRSLALALLRDPPSAGAPRNRDEDANRAPTPAEELDRHLRPRLEQVGYRIAHLVGTNLSIVAGSSRGRFRGRPTVLEDHVDRFQQLFASGQPILITPFKPMRPQRPGRPTDGLPPRSMTNGFPGAWPGGNRDAEGPRPEFGGFRPNFNGTNRPTGFGPGTGRFSTNGPPPRRGDLTLMQVAVPIRDDAGQIQGAFTLVIDPEREFTRILSVARSGVSGETYALDQRGLLISRSRFDEQLRRLGLIAEHPESTSALNLRLSDPGTVQPTTVTPDDTTHPTRPLTHLAAAAIAGGTGVDVSTSRDYRGIPVIGAWRWLPQHGFGVVTQINASEAYQSLRVLNFLFLILFLLLLLCSTGMLLVSRANLTWRRRLDQAELRLRQLGQYTLQEKIGEGAMGVVYRARHGLLRRDTAVKLLLPDRADAESVARFEREVCLSCQLTHPNTIQVFDYGRTPDGIFYYAMEYLRGLNLHDLVGRYGPQPQARVIHILVQICDSLSEAHALGLVHRDIKPANVFLCHRGGIADCVKVLDFGLIREFRSGSELSPASPSTIEGTPSFIPPEAIHNRSPIDPRSDLYSVGALGYYLVCGQAVFEAEDVAELYEKHLHDLPLPPSRRSVNAVGKELEAILLECLAKEPTDRPPSADALRRRLASLTETAPWLPAQGAEWWSSHPEASVNGIPHPPGSSSLRPDPTLKVDLNHRDAA